MSTHLMWNYFQSNSAYDWQDTNWEQLTCKESNQIFTVILRQFLRTIFHYVSGPLLTNITKNYEVILHLMLYKIKLYILYRTISERNIFQFQWFRRRGGSFVLELGRESFRVNIFKQSVHSLRIDTSAL